MSYLRKTTAILLIVLCLFTSFSFSSCKERQNQETTVSDGKLHVTFVDVGNGDCITIKLPDGKILMIDCGENLSFNEKAISDTLKGYSATFIDYLVLTHPDNDHVGNAPWLVGCYPIKNAYIPNILDKTLYTQFNTAYNVMKENKTNVIYSDCYKRIDGGDYFIAFLSPLATDGKSQSYYSEFNGFYQPNSKQINDLSPIIYLQCMGIRMVFTGDASSIQEKLVIQNYLTGFYDQVFGKGKINLVGVDFLKLGHHGDDKSSSQEFLQILLPKNAVVSCGTANPYGHPASSTLDRLVGVNPTVNLYRTDLSGNVCVTASKNNNYNVTTSQTY